MIKHDYSVEKVRNKQRDRVAKLLTKTLRQMSPSYPYKLSLQNSQAVVSVHRQGKSLIIDFHELTGPALLDEAQRANPWAEYYSADKDMKFEYCGVGYELVHQGALRKKTATFKIPLNWWQRLWIW